MAITVFVVDDHALVRSGIAQVIDAEDDLDVVGEGTGSSETLDAVSAIRPHVAVVDLEMQPIRGVDFIERVKDAVPEIRTLACTMHSAQGYVAEALRRGADGYVLKTSPSTLLTDGIRTVASGAGFLDPALQTDVVRLLKGRDRRLLATDLTAQEIEVLRLASEGLTNQEIAGRVHQSIETVKLRLRRSFQKLGAVDRANAVALALRRNLL